MLRKILRYMEHNYDYIKHSILLIGLIILLSGNVIFLLFIKDNTRSLQIALRNLDNEIMIKNTNNNTLMIKLTEKQRTVNNETLLKYINKAENFTPINKVFVKDELLSKRKNSPN